MDSPITRAEHEEFRRSVELANKNLSDENERQNARIKVLEEFSRQNMAMVANVERLAVNMENMLKEQENQGERLATLENRDGKSWRDLKSKIFDKVISVIVGAVMGGLATTMLFK